MDINPSPFSRFKLNKPVITRSSTEARAAAEMAARKEASFTGANTQQSGLKAGQIVKGQIMDYQPGTVRIQLEPDGQIITAKLSGDIPLYIGQETQFIITEASAEALILKVIPDQVSISAEAAVMEALNAAGAAMTERNKNIVTELLNHTMPVDKQTLQTLILHSNKNREASPLTLVLMHKYHIPMTSSNIKQFEAYRNGSNQLLDGLLTIVKELTGQFRSSPYQPELSNDMHPNDKNQTAFDKGPESETVDFNPQEPLQPQSQLDSSGDYRLLSADLFSAHSSSTTSSELQTAGPGSVERLLSVNEKLVDLLCNNTEDSSVNLAAFLDSEERNSLLQSLVPFSLPEAIQDQIIQGTVPVKDFLSALSKMLSEADSSPVFSLFQSPEYARLMERAFVQKWTITPETLVIKGSVAKLYHTLLKDLAKIHELSAEMKEDAGFKLQEPVKNIRENLHFMKDLNEFFTCLTLPVQLKNQDVQSDLYVFTRKKALMNKKEPLSVLLHLTLDHLGPTNIYIQMMQNHINSKFYLSDSEAGNLFSEYLPSLADALKKKGYSITTELIRSYEKPDFCKDFIEQKASDHEVLRYHFDIRT